MADPFQPKFVDLVRNYTTSMGTDDFVLGPAANGFASFAAALQVGDSFYYAALGVDNPADTEVGRGTLLSGGVVSRDPIGGTKTNFKSGTKAISLITAADWFGDAHALVGSVSSVGQSLVSAATATDARAVLALDHVALNPASYGLIEGDDPANGAANSAAMSAMFAAMADAPHFRLIFPAGIYWFANTIDTIRGNLVIEGAAGGGNSSTSSVKAILRFPAGVTGIRIQGAQTSGANGFDAAEHDDGRGTIIRDLVLQGSFIAAEAEAHGIQLRTMASIENVTIENFEGDGIHISAALASGDGAEPAYGNANNCFISNVTCLNNRDGIFISGSDANATTIVRPVCFANRRWGIQDLSAFGSTIVGAVLTANGITAANDGVAIGASQVSQNGNLYAAIAGQEAWCSTNAPSGTTAANQGWYYMFAGPPQPGRPAWASGIVVRAGGAVHDNSAVGASLYLGCYAEGDQGKAQIQQPSKIDGGLLATWAFDSTVLLGASAPRTRGGLDVTNTAGALVAEPMLSVKSGAITTELGGGLGNGTNRVLSMSHPTLGQQAISYSIGLGNVLFGRANGAATCFQITTIGTTSTFGTGAAVLDAFNPVVLVVTDNGRSLANGRRVMIDTAAPASGAHGQGEWCLYRGGTAGLVGWKCVAAGTPGTWEPIYSGYGSGPIGYAAGAGGAVIQATSKSTAVTLNKLSGQITMNAEELAAGAAVSFTVENSQVAATDTIKLALASGNGAPGTYNYQVDGVTPGSFVICIRNISEAALGEALTFNFSILKGANS
jgi:hypothetical protein